MNRRYNPYYNSNTIDPYAGATDHTAPIDWSNTEGMEMMAKSAMIRQGRYDEAAEKYANAMAELGSVQGAEADQPALVQYLADKGEGVKKNIQDLYGNDLGLAKNYIMGEVSKLRPVYAQAAKIGQEEAKQKQLYEQLNAQDKLIGDMGIFQKPTFDSKTGRFTPRVYDPLQRSEYDKELQPVAKMIDQKEVNTGLYRSNHPAFLKEVTAMGLAAYKPEDRKEIIDNAVAMLRKNTTWDKDNKFIKQWSGDEQLTSESINKAAVNYVDNFVKNNAVSKYRENYLQNPDYLEALRKKGEQDKEMPRLPSKFIKSGKAQFKLPGYEDLSIGEAYDKAIKNNDNNVVNEIKGIYTNFDNSTDGKVAKELMSHYRNELFKTLKSKGVKMSDAEANKMVDNAMISAISGDESGAEAKASGSVFMLGNTIDFIKKDIKKRSDLFSKTNETFKKFRDEYSAPILSFDANSSEDKKKAINFVSENSSNGMFLPIESKYSTGTDQASGWDSESLNDFNAAVSAGNVKDIKIIQATKHTKSPIVEIGFNKDVTIGKTGTPFSDDKKSLKLKISNDPEIREAAMVEMSVLGQDPSIMYEDRNAYLEGIKGKDGKINMTQYGKNAFIDEYEGGGFQFIDNDGNGYWGQTPASAEENYKMSNGLRNMTEVYLEKVYGVNMSKSDKAKYAQTLLNQ